MRVDHWLPAAFPPLLLAPVISVVISQTEGRGAPLIESPSSLQQTEGIQA